MKKESSRDKGPADELAELNQQLKGLMEKLRLEQAAIDSFLIEHPGVSELAVKRELLQILQLKTQGKEPTGG